MFQPNWPSSSIQFVFLKTTATAAGTFYFGARGNLADKALGYKSDSRGFETR
jgi:hypothetical protein